jgi:hypothetical protein
VGKTGGGAGNTGKGKKALIGDGGVGGDPKPEPSGGRRKTVKGCKETKVASGDAVAGATKTDVPPPNKRGRPRKGDTKEDMDGSNDDNGPPRKRVRRSDDLAVAEASLTTGPRVRVQSEKGLAQVKK